ncbi:MAG: hypothetical protein E7385_02715 [Ruminococcaceae bacterium]|nr:hypothetical protein [Oscillospiraceae bacterium]
MKMKKYICLLLLFVLVFSCTFTVNAETPYSNYYLNMKNGSLDMPLPIPAAYEVYTIIDNPTTETGKLKNPQDIFIDDDDNIYVVDTGNNRIVKYDSDYNYVLEISGTGTYPEDMSALKNPKCVYVDSKSGTILVADSGNSRIVEYTKYGNLLYSFETPNSELLSEDFVYQPMKVTKDTRGYIYVCNNGDYNGIMQLSADGEFRSYYGTNKVNLSFWESLAKVLWDREDRKGSVVTLPYTFTNIFASDDGYMYATTTTATPPQVRKINIAGSDVLYGSFNFVDQSVMSNMKGGTQTFIDVTVDSNNNMFILDQRYCRVYSYDKWGNNICVFGSDGLGRGQIRVPVSIEVDSRGRVYVLDDATSTIIVYEPTDFIKTVHKANNMFINGQYEESLPIWEEILEKDSYYTLALINKGKIEMRKALTDSSKEYESYKTAMDYFVEAEDAANASTAYVEIRTYFIRENFSIIVIVIVALLLLLIGYKAFKRYRRKKYGVTPEKKNVFTAIKNFFGRVYGVIRHPVDGFEGIRYENKGSYSDMFLVMILYTIVAVASEYVTSFIFRDGQALDLINPMQIVLTSLLPWFVMCVVNYGVTTIMYGEGRLRDVFIAGAYCHAPWMFAMLPIHALTQILTLEEASLWNLCNTILMILVIFLVYFAIKGIHGFHPVKAFVVLFITVVGVAAVAMLFMLVYGLTSQLFTFISQIVKELGYLV